MFKRIALVLLFIAITVGFGFALYRIIFGPPEPVVEPPPDVITNVPPGGLTPAGEGPAIGEDVVTERPEVELPGVAQIADGGITQVNPIATAPTTSATLSSDGSISFYNRQDGKFYRMNDDGTVGSLSDKQFFNVDNATFDPAGSSAIIEYPDGSNIYYDFSTNKQVTLPRHWEDFDFSPQGNQIVAKSIGIDDGNRFLITSNPDGSGAIPIQELGNNANKVKVAWSPNNQIVATSETGRPFGVDRQEIYFVGKHHENFRSMIVEGLNFQPHWSPDGEQLLYSAASGLSNYKPRLWIVDAAGDNIGLNRRMINVDTWAEKCTFADVDTLYCAVPTDLPRGAGLQPAVADSTPDEIYRIDLVTGLQTRVAIPEGSHTVDSLMLTPDGSSLYFTDKGTGILNEIKLTP
jgi:WD40 repeat protein